MISAPQNAGAAFVDRFLLPVLMSHFGGLAGRKLSCLHLSTSDDDEAARLREYGHQCFTVPVEPSLLHQTRWFAPATVACGDSLPFARRSFDLIFTNAFGRFAPDAASSHQFASEICELLRPGGAVLLCVGNRKSPLNLGGAAGARFSLSEMREAFQAKSSELRTLSAERFFGWSRIPGPLRPLLFAIKWYIRFTSTPHREAIYDSPLNSFFLLWVVR